MLFEPFNKIYKPCLWKRGFWFALNEFCKFLTVWAGRRGCYAAAPAILIITVISFEGFVRPLAKGETEASERERSGEIYSAV